MFIENKQIDLFLLPKKTQELPFKKKKKWSKKRKQTTKKKRW